ncbi:RNA pseudouridylate synthase family protein, putative [Babesia bigemina]|uniref:RNA pseudouridylate synthase family protein, putative n=1 Tax=Babesia bigemina TaxID=5866 RepID=A0A061DE37_BABBI|nr:RNA pseudouridylate synthase family protein, putative [Babesia bigemina]CDR97949.1 RNA pseudouridylate synthase family protein, putative [Babesia bigemina]|eukprot:XP_012770135.1 RNA pseudouridylate synthase family protein, putative [Babesia bigemina]
MGTRSNHEGEQTADRGGSKRRKVDQNLESQEEQCKPPFRSLNATPNDSTISHFIPTTQPTYHFKNGFRIVLPYNHVYETNTKGRWFGRRLYDVMASEFAAFTDEYVRHACAHGLMKVFDRVGNDLYPEPGEHVMEHICRPNEKIWHLAIVHEQLALDTKVCILREDEDYIAVSKPCSIPVYHTGTYHFNTLVEVLKHEVLRDKNAQLYPVHRLDKLTSGVIILAKNSKAASAFCEGVRNNELRKVYVARVRGDFSPVFDNHKCLAVDDGIGDGRVACCHGFMRVVSHKLSVHEFTLDDTKSNVKPAETRFRLVSHNPELKESLILCYPVTGRTHQIRAHLKFLGFPISNDKCYNDGELCDDSSYFKKLPAVHWEVDEHGRWQLPELKFVAPQPAQLMRGSSDYHVGLNKPVEGLCHSPTGIFLHALRYIWEQKFSVSDAAPKWINDFEVDTAHTDLTKMNLWLDSAEANG